METRINWNSESTLIGRLASNYVTAADVLKKERTALGLAGERTAKAVQAQQILQLCAQAVQQQAHARVSKVVTSCLDAVFGDASYEFLIKFERKRGKTDAVLVFRRDGVDFTPTISTGGGVVDVAAMCLRVVCLCLHRPRLSKVLVLDEPLKFVSSKYQANVKQMLEKLATDLNVQIVMVTHQTAISTGTVIELE